MPDLAEFVIRTYQEAAAANVRNSARQGNLIELAPPLADEVMVTADLHGHRVNFEKLIALADLDHYPGRHLIMQEVCHGGPTYPSGNGCMSHLLLEDVAALKVRYPERFHFLLSNHELAELINYPVSKGRRMLNLAFRCGLQEMYGSGAEKVRGALEQFLRSCPLAVRLSNGIFICHSIPEDLDQRAFDASIFSRPLCDEDYRSGGAVFELVWGRDFRRENASAFAELVKAKLLIQGHEPCEEGFLAPNDLQVILDCCGERACYLLVPTTGELTQGDLLARIQRLW